MYESRRGANHFRWKGDNIRNETLHQWLASNFGKADHCENCDGEKIPKGKKHWFEWSNKTGQYNRRRENWWQLCVPCHRKYDDWNGKVKQFYLDSKCWENRERDKSTGRFV